MSGKSKVDLREERKKLVIYKRPMKTLLNASFYITRFLKKSCVYLLTHPIFLFALLPFMALYAVCKAYPNSWSSEAIEEFEVYLFFIVWWVGLGVASSVGFGSGLHTGLVFLFPHILVINNTAAKCNSTSFDSRHNMWSTGRGPHEYFDCDVQNPEPFSVTFVSMLYKGFWAAFLWGAGTAVGELPPYATSYAAASAGKADEEYDQEMSEISKDSKNPVIKMKAWMIDFLKNHGFWGVLLMAAWPNAFFDLCGLCCGHFMMPFWTFFSAVFIGKALIKVSGQLLFFTTLFFKGTQEWFKETILKLAKHVNMEKKAKIFLERLLSGVHGQGEANSSEWNFSMDQVFHYLVLFVILYFLVGCLEQFAQAYQKELDEAASPPKARGQSRGRKKSPNGSRGRSRSASRGALRKRSGKSGR